MTNLTVRLHRPAQPEHRSAMTYPTQNSVRSAAQPLRIVSPAYVATTLLFIALIITVLIGSFIVRVPVVVEGQGMLMADSEVANFAILPENEGRLEEFLVKSGASISKGQTIARVSIPRLESDIETAQIALNGLQQKNRLLSKYHKESLEVALVTLKQQRLEARNREQVLRDRLVRLERSVEGDAELIRRGFLSTRGGDILMTEKGQVEDQLFMGRRQLIEAEASYTELAQRLRREMLDLDLQISNQGRQLNALLERRKLEGLIVSPYDGIVSELLVDLHQPVTRERRVASITPTATMTSGKPEVTTAVVFVPAAMGKKLLLNMPVQLLPLIFEEQEFGRIEGVVTHISPDAADDDTLVKVFKNQRLVRKLFDTEAPYKVQVALNRDARSVTGLSWTGSRGPNRAMEPGTIVSSWVVYDQPRLIYLLLPAIKRIGELAWINSMELWQGDTKTQTMEAR